MKIFHKGFTLVEILVAIGIIGVVSAVTIPALMNSSNERVIAPTLAKTVHNIEHGFQNIIQTAIDSAEDNQSDEDVENNLSVNAGIHNLDLITYNDILGNDDDTHVITVADIFSALQGATGTVELENSEFTYLNQARMYNDNTIISSNNKYSFINGNNGTHAYRFPKTPSIFIFEPADEDDLNDYASTHNNNIDESVIIARIAIDANGETGPNRLGHDIFLFGITNSGRLVPAGSQAYNNNSFNDNLNEDLYTDADNGCNGDTVVGNGASCAARVVTDGWKINYK